MKTKEEIRATTGRIPKPANYKYGEKLKEWDATLTAGQESVLAQLNPIHDRIIVKLIKGKPKGHILLTIDKPLIGGDCRPALILKCGPGRWITEDDEPWLRPMAVKPGETVYIGNWVDLEADGLALCQEGDIRGYVNEVQTAQNGAHRKAQVSKGRHKRRTGRSPRLSHAAKTL